MWPTLLKGTEWRRIKFWLIHILRVTRYVFIISNLLLKHNSTRIMQNYLQAKQEFAKGLNEYGYNVRLKIYKFFPCINVCISKDNTSLFDIKSTLLPFKVCKILRMRKKLWLGAWSEMSSGISKNLQKTYYKPRFCNWHQTHR